nr:11670_t:CDS:1 [Entrophospora candida]CAG8597348.1 13795_t:CDS:1 [Entrophospora candida]
MSKAAAAAQRKLAQVKCLIPAGKATPQPPLSATLGQRGIKVMEFCKLFNERTKKFEVGTLIPTRIKINPDRTFTFETNLPPVTWLLKRAAKIEKGASKAGHEWVGKISLKELYEIALIKHNQENLKRSSLQSICKSIIATAKGMGIQVVP